MAGLLKSTGLLHRKRAKYMLVSLRTTVKILKTLENAIV